jgi:cell division protein FtsL
MPTILTQFKPYIYGAIVLTVIATVGYVIYLQSILEDKKIEVTQKEQKIKEKDEDIKNIIDGYETTLKVEKEIATEKAITQEQKQEVIKTTSKLKEAVIKRGEIKQDEKSNFTIVSF